MMTIQDRIDAVHARIDRDQRLLAKFLREQQLVVRNKRPRISVAKLKKRLVELTGEEADIEVNSHTATGITDVWAYHYGFNNDAMGEACHLIHEGSLEEVWDILKGGLTRCDCHDCEEHRTALKSEKSAAL
jgi:hypothetical protein